MISNKHCEKSQINSNSYKMKLKVSTGISGEKIEVFASTGGKKFSMEHPLLIFLHGAGMDHTVWNLQTRYFAFHGYSVLSIDFPGHGRSKGPIIKSIEKMADWVSELIKTTFIAFGDDRGGSNISKRVSLIGHSMGALVALECSSRYPKLINSLSMLGVSAEMPVHPVLLEASSNHESSDSNETLAYDLVNSWCHGEVGHFGKTPVPGISLIGGGRALLNSAPKGALGVGLRACNSYKNGMTAAENVKCPTLFLMGDEDKMTPPKLGLKLSAVISKSKTHILDGCGHMMMLEKSYQTLHILKGHMSQTWDMR